MDALKAKANKAENDLTWEVTAQVLGKAEQVIHRQEQMNFMKDDYNLLMHHGRVKRSSTIYNLSPIMRNGLVCVGGRLQYSGLQRMKSTK